MSLIWLMFACLTVLGSVLSNVGIKLAADKVNAFVFMASMSAFALLFSLIILFISKYTLKTDMQYEWDSKALSYGALAGFGAILIDLAFIYALRHGSLVASQAFWSVGGLVALTIISMMFFHETMTIMKALGVIMGIGSLYILSQNQ